MRFSRLVLILLGMALLGRPERHSAAPVPFGNVGRHKSVDAPLPAGAFARLGTSRLRHGGRVLALSFTRGGKLFSAAMDGSLRLWEPATGGEIWCLDCPPEFLPHCAALSPDGRFVAASSTMRDKPVHLWDTATRKVCLLPVKPRRSVTFLAFSPDSKTLATVEGGRLICLWEVRTGKTVRQFKVRRGFTSTLAFSPDGQWIVSGEVKGDLCLWKVATGELVRVLQVQPKLLAVAFAPDGKTFASTDGNRVALWKTATGERVRRFEGHQQPVGAVAFSPDGQTLLASDFDGSVREWDVASGRAGQRLTRFLKQAGQIAFSPDGKIVAAAGNQGARLWDVATGRELHPASGHLAGLWALAFSPDGNTLASADRVGVILLWDVTRHKLLRRLEGDRGLIVALAFSPNGKTLASTGPSKLRLWDVPTGKPLWKVTAAHPAGFASLAFSADGKRLAAGCHDQTVRLWDLATGNELRRFRFPERTPSRVFFSADEQTLTAAGAGQIISTWTVASGIERLSVRSKAGNGFGVAVSADGRNLAGHDTDHVFVWEMATGKERARIPHKEWTWALAFSPDGKRLVGSLDRSLCIWDPSAGREVGRLPGLPCLASVLAFAADGKPLASGGSDGAILLWHADRLPGSKPAAARALTTGEVDAQWKALRGQDATRAYRALGVLRTVPRQVLPLLRRELRPTTPANPRQVARLVEDLDSKSFAVRAKATAELGRLGHQAEAALVKALESNPSKEMRQRIKELLEKTPPTPDRVQTLRMLELVEHLGTPEARQMLKALADNPSDPWLAAEAKAAMARLRSRQPAKS